MSGELRDRLEHAEPAERRAACREAATHPAATLLAPALVRALADADRGVARSASDSLVRIGRVHGGLEDLLRDALHSEDPLRRFGAAFTAARLEPPTPRLLPALVEALASGDGDVRWASARILVDMGRLHAEVAPLLAGLACDDPRAAVRRMAIHALRSLADDGGPAERALLAATEDPEAPVRRAALTALAGLPEGSDEILARLTAILRADDDPASRRLAALALGALGARGGALPPHAAHALADAARGDDDDDLCRAARRAQQTLGSAITLEEGP